MKRLLHNARPGTRQGEWRTFAGMVLLYRLGLEFWRALARLRPAWAVCAATVLLSPRASLADALMVTNDSPAFPLDTRLSATTVVFPNLIAQTDSPAFSLDTRLPNILVIFPNLVTQIDSLAFTLDTRLQLITVAFPNLITQIDSPAFTLDTRLQLITVTFPNLITQLDSPAFTLDTRLPCSCPFPPVPNPITQADSPAFTLDTWLHVTILRYSSGNLRFSWPTNAPGYHLQRTASLSPPVSWKEVTNPPATNGAAIQLTLTPPAGQGAEFYKLVGP